MLRVRRRLRAATDTTSSETPRLERDASRSGERPLHNRCRSSEGRNLSACTKGGPTIRRVLGRKTDVKDAEWIAELQQHGLVQASSIPDRPQRELTCYRRSLIEERSREANRIQKLLEAANIKLASVASDVLGVSSQAMLTAMASGEEDPDLLAGLAKERLREKKAELEQALRA